MRMYSIMTGYSQVPHWYMNLKTYHQSRPKMLLWHSISVRLNIITGMRDFFFSGIVMVS
jgi:hypothetical protein